MQQNSTWLWLASAIYENDQHTDDELHNLEHAQAQAKASAKEAAFDAAMWYYREKVHGPLGILLCCLGLALNALSCVILRKKEIMVTGNLTLVAVSVFYMLISLAFLPLLITMYCITPHSAPKDKRNSYLNMLTAIVSNQVQLTAHAIVLWLGVLMALQRLLCTTSRVPISQNRLLSKRFTRLAIWLIVVLVTAASIPSYLVSNLDARPLHTNLSVYQHRLCRNVSGNASDDTLTLCWNVTHVTDFRSLCIYYVMTLRPAILRAPVHWTYSILHKILPCLLMMLLSAFLVRSLHHLVGRRKRLIGAKSSNHEYDDSTGQDAHSCSNFGNTTIANGKNNSPSCSAKRLREVNRNVTRMVIVLVVLMVVTQLPPAILLVCNPNMYRRFGDAFDVFSMLDNTASFFLYCKMSAAFREQFIKQLHSILTCWRHVSKNNSL